MRECGCVDGKKYLKICRKHFLELNRYLSDRKFSARDIRQLWCIIGSEEVGENE